MPSWSAMRLDAGRVTVKAHDRFARCWSSVPDLAREVGPLTCSDIWTMALFFRHGATGKDTTFRTTHARRDALSLGSRRAAPRCGSAARPETAGRAPAARAHRCACPAPRNDPVEARPTELTSAAIRTTVPRLVGRSVCSARLSGGALLDPTRPCASLDRSAQQSVDRRRYEERRCPHRQAREPALRAQRLSARNRVSRLGRQASGMRIVDSPLGRLISHCPTHDRKRMSASRNGPATMVSGVWRALARW
jgi:hypothetical protein